MNMRTTILASAAALGMVIALPAFADVAVSPGLMDTSCSSGLARETADVGGCRLNNSKIITEDSFGRKDRPMLAYDWSQREGGPGGGQ